MNCPLHIPENAQVLLDYGARKLDAERTETLERHMAICPGCREFAAGQRAMWEALDSWEAAPVSQDFDRKLYQRIEQEVSWWDLLVRPFRPLMVRRGVPVAAAACLLVMAGVLIERPTGSPVPKKDMAQMESVQPEQVEQALDTMEMLSEFSHHVRNDGQESKL
ncbi:MAG: putative transrane anti-sigma factor [Candidatus Solibacter sp.]|jgi:anti-sigma factor RsiW|nr:putative transrane anti-sigma factor [Candidatus Solibacter sp.]